MMNMKDIKPFVKWAGGKTRIIQEIQNRLPNYFNSYYEPFVGGGSVLLNIKPNKGVINDYNFQLINVYLVIKNNVDELIKELKKHETLNSKEHFYDVRQWDRDGRLEKKSLIEQAARIIYLNKTDFNGLYRVNSKNQFNVSYANYKNPNIVNETTLRAVSSYLQTANIQILTGDFKKAILNVRKDDFVYFDPPYVPMTQDSKTFTEYTSLGFGEAQQIELRDIFKELSSRRAYVMLSNNDTPFVRKMYQDFNIYSVKCVRTINNKYTKNKQFNEVIITNY